MSKVIDIDPRKRVSREQIDDIITELNKLPADKVQSVFLVMGVEAPNNIENAEGNMVYYTHHYNIGFSMLGFLEANLSIIKTQSFEPEFIGDPYDDDPGASND